MIRNKSAKDLAFERERIKLKKKIQEKDDLVRSLRSDIVCKDEEISRLCDCIDLLCKYADMTESEIEELRQREIRLDSLDKHLSMLLNPLLGSNRF